ncbi:hypothetical protein VPH35_003045 [Triticum aestivum]
MAFDPSSLCSISSRLQSVVSGLGLSESLGSAGSFAGAHPSAGVEAPDPAAGTATTMPWRRPGPSHKALWRRRKWELRQRQLAAKERPRFCSPSSSQERGEIWSDLFGLCFKCFREGHRMEDRTFKPLCFRCGLEGHI